MMIPTVKLNERCQTIVDFVGSIFMLLVALGILSFLTGCTVHMGVDWNGETAIDHHTFTSKDKK